MPHWKPVRPIREVGLYVQRIIQITFFYHFPHKSTSHSIIMGVNSCLENWRLVRFVCLSTLGKDWLFNFNEPPYSLDRNLKNWDAGYFHNDRKRMNYLDMRSECYQIGSDMVERAAKQYKSRFCGPDMRWNRKGAEGLLACPYDDYEQSFRQNVAFGLHLTPNLKCTRAISLA